MNTERLIDQLRRDEGLRLKPYTDTAGKLTIGIGRNLSDRGITEEEADMMLLTDLRHVVNDLNRALPWWVSLNEVRQEALANMLFNLGLPRLLTFKKLLAALEAGQWARAAAEALDSRWAQQVGARAVRIAEMFQTGKTELEI